MLSLCCVCTVDIQTSPTYRGYPNKGGNQTYRECVQTYRRTSKHGGCPNIQGASKHRGTQTYPKNTGGASKHMGVYRHPLSLTKHAFFVLCVYSGHPNIQGGIQTREASKHRQCPNLQGGIQTYGGNQTYRRVSEHMGVSKHTVDIQTYGGI